MKIPVSHGTLEANLKLAEGERRAAAVLCHPHPLHGGNMHTKAVFRAAQALSEVGMDVVRFNFRGVGLSTGSYDGGVGEQDDARAALDWLASERPGVPLILGGFSFGSRVALAVGKDDPRVIGLVCLGLPVSWGPIADLARIDKPTLVVQGELDEFGSGAEVARTLAPLGQNFTLARIPGADHYFYGSFDELRESILSYFTEGPGDRLLSTTAGVGGEDARS